MGLGGMKYAWQRQTKDFAHNKGDQYSSLVTDNRGIGDSDKPTSRYSTSAMAADLVEVLDHIGWTGKRELHVIGISMGGMIAQEIVSSIIPSSSFSTRMLHVPSMNTNPFTCSRQKLETILPTSDTRHHPVI
jgi:alpha-beta hydrolase superfamily lysophospholipase